MKLAIRGDNLLLASAVFLFALTADAGHQAEANMKAMQPQAAFPIPDDPQAKSNAAFIDARTIEAVNRGLKYLAEHQNANGSWSCKIGSKLGESYIGDKTADHTAVTALACMAFLAGGHVPGRSPYGANVEHGLDWLLKCVRDDGYITYQGTRMYEHAFCTLFLSEVLGMVRGTAYEQRVKETLKRAVNLIINSQFNNGGWRYQPIPADADISVTVSTLQALRAARNAGVGVPRKTIDKAMEYIHKSATQQGFKYQLQDVADFTRYTVPLTACGVVSLFSAGEYRSKEITWGLDFLRRRYRTELFYGQYHFFYGHYYMVQSFYQAGDHYWREYFPWIRDQILAHQKDDGGWQDDVGRMYATAMACLILEIPYNLLPIFQK